MIEQAWAMGSPGQDGASSMGGLLLPMVLIFAIFYFLIIRPQQKRQKEQKDMMENLRRGDRVITTSGIYGTITGIKPDLFVVKIADKVRIEIQKSAVSSVVGSDKQGAQKEE